LVSGPGSDVTEEPAVRVQSRPRWLFGAVPVCPPGPWQSGSGIGGELAVDGVADASLQRAECFLLGLPSAILRV
jgi:hypothetical protein